MVKTIENKKDFKDSPKTFYNYIILHHEKQIFDNFIFIKRLIIVHKISVAISSYSE